MDATPRPLGRIITFYSYKGGTGRSMALANIAWMLASAGRRVLAIDWDLEAPGLHRYFRPFLIDDELTATDGLIDLVDAYANAAIRPAGREGAADPDWFLPYTDFSDYIVSVNFPHFPPGGKIDFLPAGRQGDRYAVGVSSFNWQNFYDRLGGGGFFEGVKRRARAAYDYVLIDSRTGVSDTAGICSVQMPDTLVVGFTYNNQSIKGAAAIARSARDTHKRLADEKLALHRAGTSSTLSLVDDAPRPFRIFPVPMRVDSGESDRLAIRQRFAQNLFADLVEHIDAADVVSEYWRPVEVPYAVFYAYEEVLAPFKDDPQDPKTVLASLLRLTRFVTDGDVTRYHLLLSPEERQAYLDAFARVASSTAAPKTPVASQETEEQKLARSAETAVALLPEDARATAARILLRLVRVGREEDGGVHAAIRVPLSEFSDPEKEIIKHLVAHGVVVVGAEARPSSSTRYAEPTVSLADVRLLTAWRTLIDWIEHDREFMLWRQQLRAYMADWERSGQDRGALLTGRLLSEADLIAVRRRDDLTGAEARYIEQSRTARQVVEHPQEVRVAAPPAASVQIGGAPRRRFVVLGVAALLFLTLAAAGAAVMLWTRPGTEPPDTGVVQAGAIAVPRLIDLSATAAKMAAEAIRLQVLMTDGTSPDAPLLEGVVVDQAPSAGTRIEPGGVVRLTVSALAATAPTLTGMNLTEANKALGEHHLRLGETQSRYVPDAPVDSIIDQQPPPGTKVAAGSAVNVAVARAARLSDFRIGIYYVQDDPASKMLADRLRTLLRRAGSEAVLSPRPREFFTGRREPTRHEIRYSSPAERQLADELQKLSQQAGDIPPLAPRLVRNSSEGFISVFLMPEGEKDPREQQQLQKRN